MTETMNDSKEPVRNGDGFDEDDKTALQLADDSMNGASNACLTTVVDIDGRSDVYKEFVGLKKEDLVQFATDPYWVRVRLTLMVAFWIGWIGMLTGAVLIIYLAPQCPPSPQMEWWQPAIVYHVYPRSFQDTDGDGIGDLKGVLKHLEYFKNLSVSTVWLNSIYSTDNVDFGYDITDYVSISPTYGTMDDFSDLVSSMHKQGLKLIMDFVPNHTSRNHTWFQESRKAGSDGAIYRDFYVWHPGKVLQNGSRTPPNNWLSVFGKSAWEYDHVRKEYYLHQFLTEQPDLNLMNPDVIQHLDSVLRFWLEKGVDGFYLDSAAYLIESSDLTKDEPLSGQSVSHDDYRYLDHPLTRLQPESFELVSRWRELLDNYSHNDGRSKSKFYPRLLIAEVYATPNESIPFASYQGRPGAHIVTNMMLLQLKQGCHANCIHDLVKVWMDETLASELWSNWQLGNQDHSRVATRTGSPDYVSALNMLLLVLPGTAFTYYGEEIGMHDVDVTWDESQDPLGRKWGKELYMNYSRDPQRSPMQWSDDPLAGFTKSQTPWLPIAKDYCSANVQAQLAHGYGVSNLNVYSDVAKLRQSPSMIWGNFSHRVENNIYFVVRHATGYPGFLAAMNFGTKPSSVNFVSSSPISELVPDLATVVTSTGNFKDDVRTKEYAANVKVKMSSVHLKPAEGIIFSWEK